MGHTLRNRQHQPTTNQKKMLDMRSISDQSASFRAPLRLVSALGAPLLACLSLATEWSSPGDPKKISCNLGEKQVTLVFGETPIGKGCEGVVWPAKVVGSSHLNGDVVIKQISKKFNCLIAYYGQSTLKRRRRFNDDYY